MSLPLSNHEKSLYSQYGEDGVLEFLLKTLSESGTNLAKRVCEFGAWDGKHLSNARNLIVNHGYSAVLIEMNKHKFDQLQKNYGGNEVVVLRERVDSTLNTLDTILERNSIPLKIDVLSIDIDGDDFHIFESLKNIFPFVVVVEYNPSIPLDFSFINPLGSSQGSSAKSIVQMAYQKGYSLVHRTPANLIFVHTLNLHLFGFVDGLPVSIPIGADLKIPKVFFGFDGSLHFTEKLELPWHSIVIESADLQPLPFFLRRIPTQYNSIQNLGYFVKVFGWVALLQRIVLKMLRRV